MTLLGTSVNKGGMEEIYRRFIALVTWRCERSAHKPLTRRSGMPTGTGSSGDETRKNPSNRRKHCK